jgi:hypothetical protein
VKDRIITSLAHKLCASVYFYDEYRILRHSDVVHTIRFGDLVYVKRLSAFDGRFYYAGAFYLHVSKKPKMCHFVFDNTFDTVHMIPRSHVVKPLPTESSSDDKMSIIVEIMRRIAHHVSIHRILPDLPAIRVALMDSVETGKLSRRKVSFDSFGAVKPTRRSGRKKKANPNLSEEESPDYDSDIYDDGYGKEDEASDYFTDDGDIHDRGGDKDSGARDGDKDSNGHVGGDKGSGDRGGYKGSGGRGLWWAW